MNVKDFISLDCVFMDSFMDDVNRIQQNLATELLCVMTTSTTSALNCKGACVVS